MSFPEFSLEEVRLQIKTMQDAGLVDKNAAAFNPKFMSKEQKNVLKNTKKKIIKITKKIKNLYEFGVFLEYLSQLQQHSKRVARGFLE